MRLLFAALLSLAAATLAAQPLERVAPEEVGMDASKLAIADGIIENAISEVGIPGAVLAVVRHGKMAYIKAYGNKAVYPAAEPMTVETVFDLASCSKPLGTAMSVMALVERGQIRLMDPVSVYIPGFKDWEKDGEKETIRVYHLLTHTSGLPSYGPTDELAAKYGSPSPEGLLEYICSCRRDFRPAADFRYSCLNYITLMHIVQNVSGQNLREFARENIFAPLGMDYTDYLPCVPSEEGWVNTSDPCWAPLVEGDWHSVIAPTEVQPDGQVLRGQVHDPLARVMNGGISGNAGLFSRADDIAILCAALQNGGEWNGERVLSPATVKAMRTVPWRVKDFGRSLGWDCRTDYSTNQGDLLGPDAYGHTGYTGTSVVIDPDYDISIILLVNAVHPKDEHSMVRTRSLVANAVAAAIMK